MFGCKPYIPTPYLRGLLSDDINLVRYHVVGASGFRRVELNHRMKARTFVAIHDLYNTKVFLAAAMRRCYKILQEENVGRGCADCGTVPYEAVFMIAFQTFLVAQVRCAEYYPLGLFCCSQLKCPHLLYLLTCVVMLEDFFRLIEEYLDKYETTWEQEKMNPANLEALVKSLQQ